MSRAEEIRAVPPPPRMGRALRGAVEDFYYNSWRFLGANLVVGALLIAVVLLTGGTLVAIPALAIVAVPVAGMMRMATSLQRDGHTDFGELWDVVRHPARVLVLAALQSGILLVLVVDALIGASWDSWLGTFFVVSALYGFGLLWAYAAVAWTLVLDPERDADPLAGRLRLALTVIIAHPMRMLGFLLTVGLVLAVGTILIAPVLTFAVGLVWLMIARYVLPVADRVEGRATLPLGEEAG